MFHSSCDFVYLEREYLTEVSVGQLLEQAGLLIA